MKLYNTLTRRTEPFTPLDPQGERVTMYVCGPTVYDDPHIGHARSAYIFDVLRRYLACQGFNVTFVRNVTDVDDKIIERARQELAHSTQHTADRDLKAKCREVAERYLESYHKTLERLGIQPPDGEPKATEHVIPDPKNVEATKKIDASMTGFISQLITKNIAYPAGGDVYFSVRKFSDYGKLSSRNLDELRAGARVEPGEHKKDPLDFALWKAAKSDEPSWNSPWGPGRPGWHIECSVMSTAYLGDTFDIHGGGVDLVFPHHENEVAQANAAGKPFARWWVHNGLLTVNGEKMSKSLGNFITVDQALHDCDQDADVLKMFFLGGHYRSPLNYMRASVTASKQRYDNYRLLMDLAASLTRLSPDIKQFLTPVAKIEELRQAFFSALDDDLNTPQALSALDGMRSLGSQLYDEVQEHGPGQSGEDKKRTGKFLFVVGAMEEHGKLLGLFERLEKTVLSKQIDEWFEQYKAARGSKDFKTSDTLRKRLNKEGFIVQDTGETSIIIPKR